MSDETSTPPLAAGKEPRVLRILAAFELTLAVIFLALIFVGVLWQVGGRYVPAINWAGAGEIARYSLMGMTFILVGYLLGRNGQITVAVIDTIAKGRAAVIVRFVSAILLALICALLAYEAWGLVSTGFRRTTTVIHIPLGYLFLLPLLGFISGAIRAVVKIITARRPAHDALTLEEAGAEA